VNNRQLKMKKVLTSGSMYGAIGVRICASSIYRKLQGRFSLAEINAVRFGRADQNYAIGPKRPLDPPTVGQSAEHH